MITISCVKFGPTNLLMSTLIDFIKCAVIILKKILPLFVIQKMTMV